MSLLERLEELGDRLGILQKPEAAEARAPTKILTRKVTLAELMTEIRAGEVRALAELPAELTVPFEKIYEAAGIAPALHGWTVERLRQLLLTEPFRERDRVTVQKEILRVLAGEKVEIEDLVKDAVARDQALDQFEASARKKVEERMTACQRQMAEIESKLQELESEKARLKEKIRLDTEKWSEWRKQKRAREHDLAWTVSYLIDRPVITTDE